MLMLHTDRIHSGVMSPSCGILQQSVIDSTRSVTPNTNAYTTAMITINYNCATPRNSYINASILRKRSSIITHQSRIIIPRFARTDCKLAARRRASSYHFPGRGIIPSCLKASIPRRRRSLRDLHLVKAAITTMNTHDILRCI